MAFPASDDAAVDAFHDAATRAGYRDAGGPGFDALDDGRYAACVLDPDGNTIALVSAEAATPHPAALGETAKARTDDPRAHGSRPARPRRC